MRVPDRAALVAATVITAVAGSAAVGFAALAHAGICVHHALGLASPGGPMPGMNMPAMAMAGMPMGGAAHAAPGACPILLATAAVAAVLSVVSVLATLILRPSPGEVALASAHAVLRLRFGRLAAVLAFAGAGPVAATLLAEDTPGALPVFLAAGLVTVAALVASAALVGAARLVLVFARRLVDALVAAFRLLPPAASAPWALCPEGAGVRAGVRLARRRRSRAPPSLP